MTPFFSLRAVVASVIPVLTLPLNVNGPYLRLNGYRLLREGALRHDDLLELLRSEFTRLACLYDELVFPSMVINLKVHNYQFFLEINTYVCQFGRGSGVNIIPILKHSHSQRFILSFNLFATIIFWL